MCNKNDCLLKLNDKASLIKERFQVSSLLLFGSISRGDNREGSDVDLFVEMPPKIFDLISLHNMLEEILGAKVDLVRNHKGISKSFLEEIKRDGIKII